MSIQNKYEQQLSIVILQEGNSVRFSVDQAFRIKNISE